MKNYQHAKSYKVFLQVNHEMYFYFRYNKLSRQIRELARKVKDLDVKDPFRLEASNSILEKL